MTCGTTRKADTSYAGLYWRPINQQSRAGVPNLPAPEDVFLSWLLSVPSDAILEISARDQIALIDQRAPFNPSAIALRKLLAAVAGDCRKHEPIGDL